MDYETFRTMVRASGAYQRIKGLYQDLCASRRKWLYYRLAKKQGLRAFTNTELQIRLRAKLSGRPHPNWPKEKGSLHIFLPFSVSNWEAILPRAFSIFGRVTPFNWREHGYDDRCDNWLDVRDRMNAEMLRIFREVNAVQPVDAVCGYLSGYHISGKVLAQMGEAGAAIFNFCWDDVIKFPGKIHGGRYDSPAAIADAVDLNLTNVPSSVIKYMVHSGLAMFFPEAGLPEVHRPYPMDFRYDVTFVGAKYGWRPVFIAKLQRRGISVNCFGPGWPSGALSDAEMVSMYSRSRINLGFAAIGYSKRLHCLKGRDFEVPMSGGLYLTQWNSDLELVFNIGREILAYKSIPDCAEKISWILNHPEEVEKIRQAGRARCLKDHSYEARWGRVFVLAGILKETGDGV